MQNCAAKEKMIKKHASQIFLDPIQNCVLTRSVQLEAVYLAALLYILENICVFSYSGHCGPNLAKRYVRKFCSWSVVRNGRRILIKCPSDELLRRLLLLHFFAYSAV